MNFFSYRQKNISAEEKAEVIKLTNSFLKEVLSNNLEEGKKDLNICDLLSSVKDILKLGEKEVKSAVEQVTDFVGKHHLTVDGISQFLKSIKDLFEYEIEELIEIVNGFVDSNNGAFHEKKIRIFSILAAFPREERGETIKDMVFLLEKGLDQEMLINYLKRFKGLAGEERKAIIEDVVFLFEKKLSKELKITIFENLKELPATERREFINLVTLALVTLSLD